jgi:hypothetical protein
MSAPPPADGPAPIVLIAFKRPLATLQTLYTLSRCPEAKDSELYAFCDGPRHERERADVERTREVILAHPWCGRVELTASPRNQGCARSVIEAITTVCRRHGRAIIVEDDLLVSRGFLAYMNESLRRYADDPRVMAISGHTFDAYPPEPRAVFMPQTTSWGWATWWRAWSLYQERPLGLERLDDPAYRRSFDLDGSIDYAGLLRSWLAGNIDTWDINWWWTAHHHGSINLHPLRSLVKNIGTGDSATHTNDTPLLKTDSFDLDNEIHTWPEEVRVDEAAFAGWTAYLRSMAPPPDRRLRARAGRAARRVLPAPMVDLARRILHRRG